MSERIRPVIDCSKDKILTKQSFKKETDINNIMAKFVKQGVMTPEALNKRQEAFADVSDIGDFLECQIKIKDAESAFMTLSPQIRARFGHEPAKLLDFVSDPENRDEAIELGIIEKPSKEPLVTPPVAQETTTTPVPEVKVAKPTQNK